MLTEQQRKCVECNNPDSTRIELKVAKNGKRVYFQVHCEDCGIYSHDLDLPELALVTRNAMREAYEAGYNCAADREADVKDPAYLLCRNRNLGTIGGVS